MGFKDIASAGVQTAFSVLSEFAETIKIADVPGTYDPTTGIAGTSKPKTATALILEYTKTDGQIVKPGDLNIMVQASSIGIALAGEMLVTRADKSVWRIVKVVLDPTGSLWTGNIRRTV